MNLKIEVEREAGGRWIAEVMELPGCLAYGKTQADALARAKAAALRTQCLSQQKQIGLAVHHAVGVGAMRHDGAPMGRADT